MALNMWQHLADSLLEIEQNVVQIQALQGTLYDSIMLAAPPSWSGNLTPSYREPGYYEQRVLKCIEYGVDVNARIQGHTPLMLALGRHLSPQLIKELLDLGAQVNFPTTRLYGHQDVLRYCFATNRAHYLSSNCMEYVELLLAAGANPNAEHRSTIAWAMAFDIEAQYIYKMAAHVRPNLFCGGELVSPQGLLGLLQEAGVDIVEPLDASESSVLEWAALQKEFKLVKCIVSQHDDAAICRQFSLAIYDAIQARWTAVEMRYLLQCGATPQVLNNVLTDRMTPLALACINGWSLGWPSQLDVVQLLLQFGARPDVGQNSCTPLIACIYNRTPMSLQVMQLLLEAGASPDLQSRFVLPPWGYEPLRTWGNALDFYARVPVLPLTAAVMWQCSCPELHLQYVKALLKAGATVDVQSPNGSTVLEQALKSTPAEDHLVAASKLCVALLGAGAVLPKLRESRNELNAKLRQIVLSYWDRLATIALRTQPKLGPCWNIVTSFLLSARLHAATLKHPLVC